jgi:hypothetical protein
MRDPRYQGIQAAQIPEVESAGAHIRVIAGRIGDAIGPVSDVTVEPEYLDVTLQPRAVWEHPVSVGHTAFAYLFQGEGLFGVDEERVVSDGGALVLFGDGDRISVTAGEAETRFLMVSGKPLHEPVAWRGPIVMNTREELNAAWRELDEGTFVKHGRAHGRDDQIPEGSEKYR